MLNAYLFRHFAYIIYISYTSQAIHIEIFRNGASAKDKKTP
jgi:hypothetical protein